MLRVRCAAHICIRRYVWRKALTRREAIPKGVRCLIICILQVNAGLMPARLALPGVRWCPKLPRRHTGDPDAPQYRIESLATINRNAATTPWTVAIAEVLTALA